MAFRDKEPNISPSYLYQRNVYVQKIRMCVFSRKQKVKKHLIYHIATSTSAICMYQKSTNGNISIVSIKHNVTKHRPIANF